MPPNLWDIFIQPLMNVTNDLFFTILLFVLTGVAFVSMDKRVGPALTVWIFGFLTFEFAGLREPYSGMYFMLFVVGLAGLITNAFVNMRKH